MRPRQRYSLSDELLPRPRDEDERDRPPLELEEELLLLEELFLPLLEDCRRAIENGIKLLIRRP